MAEEEKKTAGIPEENTVFDLSDLFKVFGDSTRLKILFSLQERPLYVGEMASLLGMSASAVSHQLQVLRVNRLVRTQKEGKSILYELDDHHIAEILRTGLEHVTEMREQKETRE